MNCWARSYKKKELDKMSRLDKIIAQKSHEAVFKDKLKRSKAFDCVVLLALNEVQHHTAEWLENYYKTFIYKYEDIVEKYGMGDAVITKLKDETGIDIDELYEKYVDSDEPFEKTPELEKIDNLKNEIDDLKDENAILKQQIDILKKINNVNIISSKEALKDTVPFDFDDNDKIEVS